MKKKVLRILAIVLLLIIALLVAAPFILEAKIGEIIKNNVNSNVNATLDFEDANLSLIKSFPNAELGLEGVSFINKAPFEGDTLFAAKELSLLWGSLSSLKVPERPLASKIWLSMERIFILG